jgi:hypothetical protein
MVVNKIKIRKRSQNKDRTKVEKRFMDVQNIWIGRRTENKGMVMERDRIKVEGRIMTVDIIKIGRRTENKDMIMERDRIKVEGRIMVVDNIKIGQCTENKSMITWTGTGSRLREGSWLWTI